MSSALRAFALRSAAALPHVRPTLLMPRRLVQAAPIQPAYKTFESEGKPIKAWVQGVPMEPEALEQIRKVAMLPCVHGHVAVMPDVHAGIGSTVGTVFATVKAIIPAAVGVDIGCGVCAVRTSLTANDLPDNLAAMRSEIEKSIPVGRTGGKVDKGAWSGPGGIPSKIQRDFVELLGPGYKLLVEKHPKLKSANSANHLGTLGTGNHFIEVCLDETNQVWLMLHSGSRGVGNAIGRYFIELAKKDMGVHLKNIPDEDLAYLQEGTKHFDDYVFAVEWAQQFAKVNRQEMMQLLIDSLRRTPGVPPFQAKLVAVDCHHNYVSREKHFGKDCFVTRKGAVRAQTGDLGIIPGSMGTSSYIVRGKGNPESFQSCSHGAGRAMSRTVAKQKFTVQDHVEATQGIECRKDASVVDETPLAYKNIDAVMKAQEDLVEIVHTLRQIVVVKG